jgi:hypothetical protein
MITNIWRDCPFKQEHIMMIIFCSKKRTVRRTYLGLHLEVKADGSGTTTEPPTTGAGSSFSAGSTTYGENISPFRERWKSHC